MAAPVIHVSSLSRLDAVAASLTPCDLLTLLSPAAEPRDWSALARRRHVRLAFHDIVEATPGLIAPDRAGVQAILDFGRGADAQTPMLIHCWAGISRSSAAAYVIACDRNPGHEDAIADELRRRAPSVTPNKLMVAIADDLLTRGGRMREAIARIGRGADAFEGAPYQLPLIWPIR
ncbi:MAG: tyrosine protein phosphatase [Tardiphaga sp.]